MRCGKTLSLSFLISKMGTKWDQPRQVSEVDEAVSHAWPSTGIEQVLTKYWPSVLLIELEISTEEKGFADDVINGVAVNEYFLSCITLN